MEFWLYTLLFFSVLALIYLGEKLKENVIIPFEESEGFQDGAGEYDNVPGLVEEGKGAVQWLGNTKLYDSFYAKLYDQLTQGSVRTQAEVGLMLHEWSKRGEKIENFEVLDAGCGTGIAVAALSKIGIKKVVGLDSSKAMLEHAKTVVIPQTTLTEEQKKKIEWRESDLMNTSACAGGEFSHAFLMYFTVYYFNDKEALFRNLFFWVKPGGKLTVHVVNKHKFDPMLESAAPWMGFSLQKYVKERVTKSEVVFNKFKYIGEFDLHDPEAEFRETFRFNSGKVRRQRHTFRMEDINTIVGYAKAAGWKYDGFVDLTPLSFEYSYYLNFTHP
jgi:SAM-dependent methyltransferase